MEQSGVKLTKRLDVAKIDAFLRKRAAAIKAEADHYESEADRLPGQSAYYRKMAATERCAWMEAQHIREVLCADKQDPNYPRRSRRPIHGER
jgi:hypothetical protein